MPPQVCERPWDVPLEADVDAKLGLATHLGLGEVGPADRYLERSGQGQTVLQRVLSRVR